MKIKCCGMMKTEDVLTALECMPDYVGVILAEGRRRTVSESLAKEFHDLLENKIPLVGVFVDQDPQYIERLLTENVIDIAQLHGRESEDSIRYLKERTGKQIWKAFRVADGLDEAESSPADLILLDSGTGSGETFDWCLIDHIKRDFLLAGGLQKGNLKEAMEMVHPYGVDLSSGLETNGSKDPKKMKAVMEIVRSHDRK
jgi:phosphoribosylanthranilate isomerase